MFDNAPFLVRVLLIYLNDSGVIPKPLRLEGGIRVGDLTQYSARLFEIMHKGDLSHADLRLPNTSQTTYQQQSV